VYVLFVTSDYVLTLQEMSLFILMCAPDLCFDKGTVDLTRNEFLSSFLMCAKDLLSCRGRRGFRYLVQWSSIDYITNSHADLSFTNYTSIVTAA
jgi:hypothetical protein